MLLLPLVAALTVLLVLRARKRGDVPVHAPQVPAAVYVVGSALAGAAAGFIALEAPYGIVVGALGAVLLLRHAHRKRWFSLGGLLLGMGGCAAGFLSAALTNRDPAVTYDPSTIPFFWVGTVVALCGAGILVLASTGHLRSASR